MTSPRRAWLRTFADEGTLSDLRRAAEACMSEVEDDEDRPQACGHREVDLMTPVEFVDWLERELRRSSSSGHSKLAKEHMSRAKVAGPDRQLRMVAAG